ncbi:uncharacterized protein [Asterias amurensis]|uniref:uncharacterized protein n=1 Tax=Asterias amurensis TaxID=7602 RepID=UPI003AB7B4C7
MAKLDAKTKLVFILFFMNITYCNNASEPPDCGRRQVSFEDDFSYENKVTHPGTETRSLGGFLAMGLFGIGAVIAAPVVLTGAGFTAGGIAAGSYAAGMMSSAAIANGGAIAAGSGVAVLQSVGAAGLGVAGIAVVGGAGAVVGAAVSEAF